MERRGRREVLPLEFRALGFGPDPCPRPPAPTIPAYERKSGIAYRRRQNNVQICVETEGPSEVRSSRWILRPRGILPIEFPKAVLDRDERRFPGRPEPHLVEPAGGLPPLQDRAEAQIADDERRQDDRREDDPEDPAAGGETLISGDRHGRFPGGISTEPSRQMSKQCKSSPGGTGCP